MEHAIKDLIPSHNFEILKTEVLDKLKITGLNNNPQNQNLNEIKLVLIKEIQKIRNSIDDQIEELNSDIFKDTHLKIKDLIKQLKILEDANNFLKDYFLIKNETENFETYVVKCKDFFNHVVLSLKNQISYGFEHKHFKDTENLIAEVLENIHFGKYYNKEELGKLKENVSVQRKKCLDKLIADLNEVKFDEYNYESTLNYYPSLEACVKEVHLSEEIRIIYREIARKFFDI